MAPRTVVVAGNGTNSVSFTVPPLVEFAPESVVASVDAGGAGDTTAELQVADQSGVVIAAKRQSEVVPGGDTGLATWALRLDTEAVAAGGGDYVFVEEVTPSNFGQAFQFSSPLPTDARALVVFLVVRCPALRLRFNGDSTAGHYRTIEDQLEDLNGVLTDSQAISAVTNGISLDTLASAVGFAKAVVTIPYYEVGVLSSGDRPDRSIEAEVWVHDNNPIAGYELWRHAKVAGFWNSTAAVTSLSLSALSGIAGKASLYKIV